MIADALRRYAVADSPATGVFFGNAENRPGSEPEGDHPHSLISRPHNARQVSAVETLNPEQRRAVEHGVQKKNAAPAAALLVIAGAGSGKTNTVAHRVAH